MYYEPDGQFIKTKLLDKINQQIAHLTADRTADPTKQLDQPQWTEIKDALEKEILRFEEAHKLEYRPAWKPVKPATITVAGGLGATNEIIMTET